MRRDNLFVCQFWISEGGAGSRPSGWAGNLPGSTLPANDNLCKVCVFGGQFGHSIFKKTNSLFKPRPRWPPIVNLSLFKSEYYNLQRGVTLKVCLYSSLEFGLSDLDKARPAGELMPICGTVKSDSYCYGLDILSSKFLIIETLLSVDADKTFLP